MDGQMFPGETVIWINARFLLRPVTGVERVARELVSAFVCQHLDPNGYLMDSTKPVRFALVAPPTPDKLLNPWPQLHLLQSGVFQGHLWEQSDLPWLTRGQFLLNLCNTSPVFKNRQWSFLHDAQTFAIPENFKPGLRYWYRLMFWLTARFSMGVFTNSHFSASELCRHVGVRMDRLTVAHLGVDHVDRIANEGSPRLTDLFSHLAGRPFVLAVSSDNPNKNFAAVVAALALMGSQAPACVIVGQKNDRVFARSALDTANIHHLGYVTDPELVALYRQASVMVYPSFYEGFGLPPLEAMWHACPVVVSRSSALPEVCEDAALYCNPHDPASLAKVLGQLLSDEALRFQWGQKGQQKARSYVWANTASTIMRVIRAGVLSQSP